MDLLQLPAHILLEIISYLSPRELTRCQLVSRGWRGFLTNTQVSSILLRLNFPYCREMRLINAARGLALGKGGPRTMSHNFRVELQTVDREPSDLTAAFATVARRYHNLRRAEPFSVDKLIMASANDPFQQVFRWKSVQGWDRYLRFDKAQGLFQAPDPMWWYSQEDGVLVYPVKTVGGTEAEPGNAFTGFVYELFDLETNQHTVIPFDVRNKIIRRVRLSHGVLIFDWAEAMPYRFNFGQEIHRHFATALDVVRVIAPLGIAGPKWTWSVKFRSEWKIHGVGFILSDLDRFFSAHTPNHYAVYSHRESPDPGVFPQIMEELSVWDISSPSPNPPSSVANNGNQNQVVAAGASGTGLSLLGAPPSTASTSSQIHLQPQSQNNNGTGTRSDDNATGGEGGTEPGTRQQVPSGPVLIRRLQERGLDFYRILQGNTPKLRHLAFDKHNVFFIEEDHCFARGYHVGEPAKQSHMVKSTGIPIVPFGTTDDGGPDSIPRCRRLFGPHWVDICGAEGDRLANVCRHVSPLKTPWGLRQVPPHPDMCLPPLQGDEEYEEYTTSSDESNDSSYSDESSSSDGSDDGTTAVLKTTYPWPSELRRLGLWPWNEADTTATPPTRWPGYAPCWRHDVFPFLTVAQVLDFGARVRISARVWLMYTVVEAPLVTLNVPPPGPRRQDDDVDIDDDDDDEPRRPEMVELHPDWVHHMMAAGTMAGDERWIIGQDNSGRIAILRF